MAMPVAINTVMNVMQYGALPCSVSSTTLSSS